MYKITIIEMDDKLQISYSELYYYVDWDFKHQVITFTKKVIPDKIKKGRIQKHMDATTHGRENETIEENTLW